MDADLKGFVNNLDFKPGSECLMPLFEAISNSLDSLKSNDSDPYVKIVINRGNEGQQKLLDNKATEYISSFIIEDNGEGFTDQNYGHFRKIAYTSKAGHKGIGRIFWLKAFDEVEIRSWYQDGETLKFRNFTFTIKDECKDKLCEAPEGSKISKTIVQLRGLKKHYHKYYNKRFGTVKEEIISYFLPHLLEFKSLKLIIEDGNNHDVISSSDLPEYTKTPFTIGDIDFSIYNVKAKSDYAHKKHHVAYCAANRVVRTEKIPLFSKEIEKGEEQFWYQCYVISDFLDNDVNQQRTDFNTIDEEYGLATEDNQEVFIWPAIKSKVEENWKEFLKPYEEVFTSKKKQTVENTAVANPQYDYILKDPNFTNNIPLDKTEDQILEMAQKEHFSREVNVQQEIDNAVSFLEKFTSEENLEKRRQEYNDLCDKVTTINSANLKNYVLKRSYVIKLLRELLKKQVQTGDYAYEYEVHKIIYPMITDSQSVKYDEHNLWVIDERLSFHNYLASDLPISKYSNVDSSSKLEPDLTVFKRLTLSEDEDTYHDSISIIEFKRPERDGYYKKDPVDQLFEYVEDIREGKAKDDEGSTIQLKQNSAKFFCYLICTINESVQKKFSRYGLKPNADGDRYFAYVADYNCYLEVIDFKSLLNDCDQRNKILFHKLGLN